MDQFINTETLIIELLLVASLVAIVVRRLRIPYTVALVVVGLLITFQQRIEINLTPQVILALFVPPLVFEAAFHLNFAELQRNLRTVGLFAVVGVVATMLIVALLVAWATPLSLPVALVFGALISATDPVAVVALFRTLGAPRRLAVIVEGESLLNDGTAIIVFNLALAAALTGHFDLTAGIVDFVRVSAGGLVVGAILGWAISHLIARVDDYLIETTLTTVLAFGSYLLGEQLQFSGVLAVVAAGLVSGNLGPRGMSPTTRIVLFSFWEYVAFLTNSLVFLLIGLEVNIPSLLAAGSFAVWAIVAVLVARIVVVYGLGWIANRWVDPLPLHWQHVLSWSGLRGAITLALALSLPATLGPDRDLLRVMAFAVVLFTLIVQGTTMRALLHRLGIARRTDVQVEYELRRARLTAVRAAEARLERMHREGVVSGHTYETLRPRLDERVRAVADSLHEALHADAMLESEEMRETRRELLRTERGVLLALRRDGDITDEVLEKLTTEIDENLVDTADQDEASAASASIDSQDTMLPGRPPET